MAVVRVREAPSGPFRDILIPPGVEIGSYVLTNPDVAGPIYTGRWTVAPEGSQPWPIVAVPGDGSLVQVPAGVYLAFTVGFAIPNASNNELRLVMGGSVRGTIATPAVPLNITMGGLRRATVTEQISVEQTAQGPINIQGGVLGARLYIARLGD